SSPALRRWSGRSQVKLKDFMHISHSLEEPPGDPITFDEFLAVDIRVGTLNSFDHSRRRFGWITRRAMEYACHPCAELATPEILGTARPDLPHRAMSEIGSAVLAIAKIPGTAPPELFHLIAR